MCVGAIIFLSGVLHLVGAVIVSTPQDIALADVRKGITMFKKIDVPVRVSAVMTLPEC